MSFPMVVFLLGWACALVGSFLSLPQVVHLIRSRTSAGLSLMSWQLSLAANISWVTHGFLTGRPNVFVPNAALLVCTVLVLRMIRSDRGLGVLQVCTIGVLTGLACVGVDLACGAAAFGLAVMVPQGLGSFAQLKDIVRATDLSGISPGFLVFMTVMQFAWLGWGLLAHEQSVIVAAVMMAVLTVVNLTAYLMRRTGVLQGRAREVAVEVAALAA